MNVLVVGGAGYIGSHCVRMLLAEGHCVVVLDNLCRGHREAVADGASFYEGNAGDIDKVSDLLRDEKIEVVMHFAAYAYIGESFERPSDYEENNVAETQRLLAAMGKVGVGKFVFSSTCATYGIPESLPIAEDFEQSPINPYGETKLQVENMIRKLACEEKMSSIVFRYYNAAGASEDGTIGEDHDPEPHLIPLAIGAATGKYPALKVFGTDYPTPDGTCLRDYIHVDDIARAHVMALALFSEGSGFLDYNLGNGIPVSVKEIIKAVEDVTGLPVPYDETSRREGDPPVLFADAEKARKEFGFIPEYSSIREIIGSAWRWHQSHPNGYES